MFLGFLQKQIAGVSFLSVWIALVTLFLLLAAIGFYGRFFTLLAFFFSAALERSFCIYLDYYVTAAQFFAFPVLLLSRPAFRYSLANFFSPPALEIKDADRVVVGWSRFFFELILPIAFFNAFFSKLLDGGSSWLNGDALRGYLYYIHLVSGGKASLFLAQSVDLCRLLSWITLLFEGGSLFLLIFWNAKKKYFLVAALIFHSITFFVMGINFFWMFSSLYWIYINYAFLADWIQRKRGTSAI